MYRDLYTRISAACCYISVFLDDEKISAGTGFSFRSDGQVITAAHVITGRTPIRREDYLDPNTRIYVKFPERPVALYRALFCGLTIVVEAFREPVQIDLALIAPVELSGAPYAHIPARIRPPDLGDEVFLAGYSDELELPFLVDHLLKPETKGAAAFFDAMNQGFLADMTGPLIKRGVIGNVRRIVAENTKEKVTVECDVFFVDNSVHSGASGGPVVSASGEAIGVITKRAITSASQSDAPNLQVPSGATIGLSLQPVELMCQRSRNA